MGTAEGEASVGAKYPGLVGLTQVRLDGGGRDLQKDQIGAVRPNSLEEILFRDPFGDTVHKAALMSGSFKNRCRVGQVKRKRKVPAALFFEVWPAGTRSDTVGSLFPPRPIPQENPHDRLSSLPSSGAGSRTQRDHREHEERRDRRQNGRPSRNPVDLSQAQCVYRNPVD